MFRHSRGELGTTIVEIAVGLAVGTFLVAGILVLVEQAQKAYMHSSEVTDLQQDVRVAMDRMVHVIQAAGLNPKNQNFAGPGPNLVAYTAFREAGRNCIRVYADLNGDGKVLDTDENVFFRWPTSGSSATILYETRGSTGGGPDVGQAWVTASAGEQELSRGIVPNPSPVGGEMFQYFTGPNDPSPNTKLTTPASSPTTCATMSPADRERIARVVITVTGQATIGQDTIKKTLTSEARPRNVP